MTDADLARSWTEEAAAPRWKRRLVGGLALLALAVAAVWFGVLLFAADRRLNAALAEADARDPGWRLEDLEASRATGPADANAALQVLAARWLLPAPWPAWDHAAADPDAEEAREALQASFDKLEPQVALNAAQVTALRAELQKAAAAVAEARKVAEMPRGRFTIAWSPDIISTPFPHVQEVRDVTRVLGCDVLLRAHDGDLDGALVSCWAALNTARSLGEEPLPVSQLARMACGAAALRRIERVVAQGEPSPAFLETTQRMLADEAEEPFTLRLMRGERACLDAILAAVQRGDVSVAQVRMAMGIGGGNTLRESVSTALISGSIKTNRAAALEFTNAAVELAKLPVPEQRRRIPDLEARAQELPSVARMVCLSHLKVIDVGHRSQALLRCGVAALAVERFRQDRGRWPTALAELVPQYLAQPLADPFDGQPLRLARTSQGIVVYSVGFDGQDNGGHLDHSNVRALGSDFGFELWDVPHRRQPPPP
jgi:hypothetical protein